MKESLQGARQNLQKRRFLKKRHQKPQRKTRRARRRRKPVKKQQEKEALKVKNRRKANDTVDRQEEVEARGDVDTQKEADQKRLTRTRSEENPKKRNAGDLQLTLSGDDQPAPGGESRRLGEAPSGRGAQLDLHFLDPQSVVG